MSAMLEDDQGATVFDPVRRKRVAATPEEGVRQAVLRYLIESLRVPVNLIGVEFSLSAIEPGNLRRADIVVWRPGESLLAPWLLVECKEPRVRIDDEVAFQAADYLRKIPCRYVMLSNGKDTRYLEKAVAPAQGAVSGKEEAGYRLVASLPFYQGLTSR